MLRRSLFLSIVLLLLTALALGEDATRLIMKDGSYQKITKYEVKGDRVRYYSAERYQWEEVPKELVDWTATESYEKKIANRAADDAAEAAKAKAEKAAQDAIDERDAKTPEVAPKLRLPESGGVFVVDQYGGSPQLVELTQSSSESNQHTTAYILKHTVNPLASKKETIELPGAHAKLQIHVARPTVYLNIDTDTDDDTSTKRSGYVRRPTSDAFRFEFVKLDTKRDARIMETISTNIVDDVSRQQKVIPSVGELTPGDVWIKIEPKQDLAPGEYAVVEMLGDEQINPYVWDFGINPLAPQNPPPAKPQAPKSQSNRALQ